MRNSGSLGYCFRQGIENIRRNKLFSVASVATISACLFLLGIMCFLLINIRHMLLEAETNVGVTVFFDEDIEQNQIAQLKGSIESMEYVKEVLYKSAEATWEEYKETHLSDELAATFGNDNPLEDSASFTVYFTDVEQQGALIEKISAMEGVRKVNDTKDLVDTLSKLNRVVSIGSVALVALLLAIAAFLISNTVTMGVSIRKREISIMYLIGATDFFIKAPFLVEGTIIGLIGALFPLSLLYALYYKIMELVMLKFSSLFGGLQFVSTTDIFTLLVPLCIAIGVGIGFIGSYLTLVKHLRTMRQM